MKKITIKAYTANELVEKARERVLEEYRDINVNSDWYQPIIEGFNEDMAKYGIFADARFSGFWSQGDGACFITNTVDTDIMIRKLYELGYDIPEDVLLYSKDLSVSIQKICNHYEHENTIAAFLYNDSEHTVSDHDTNKTKSVITKWARDISRGLYEKLKNYYEELTSDEAVIETLVKKEYIFTEKGIIIPA